MSSVEEPHPTDPSELRPGDHVTVLRWLGRPDNSWVGECLTVKAVQLPFLVVRDRCGRFSLDLRRCLVLKLTDEYAVEFMTTEQPPG